MTEDQRLPPLLRVGHPVAARAVLVGDPGRALALARTLLDGPLMSNHARGLWGYTGTAADGAALSVLSTGTGGPSAAAVLRELAGAGVRRVVRAGSGLWTAEGPAPEVPVALSFAAAHDGASRALGAAAGEELAPDPELHAALRAAGLPAAGVVSLDVFPGDGGPALPDHPGAVGADRQSAALLCAARRLGLPAAVVLAFPVPGEDDDARGRWWQDVGAAAAAALGVGTRD